MFSGRKSHKNDEIYRNEILFINKEIRLQLRTQSIQYIDHLPFLKFIIQRKD